MKSIINKSINEIDATLLLSYIKGSINTVDKNCVEEWLEQDEENEQILLQTARIYYAKQTTDRMLSRDPEQAFKKLQQRIKRRKSISWTTYLSRIAAFIAGAIITSATMLFFSEEKVEVVAQEITIEASAGMRTQFNLPDGTVAHLNSGSKLTYPFPYDKDERRVKLTGEAYFDVSHNPNKPFIVSVNDDAMRVKVLGTAFNIQAFADEEMIYTTLVDGSVNLELRTKSGQYKEQKLVPSEKASYNPINNELSIQTVDTESETSWTEGKLMFKNTPLPEVLRKLSHYYNVQFDVQNTIINTYTFTGTFENKQLFQILSYLKISSNIDSQINQITSDDSNGVKQSTVKLWKRE
jgi:ferric-dicitrate binding protein FerR (iron transport regulator)